jgi:Ca2+-binding RTX toxin-like protein
VTIGATADTRPMRARVLVLGLAFLGFAVAFAVQPYVASGHSPNLRKPCTVKGTPGADLLQGTSGPDVICGYGGDDTIGGNSGNDIVRGGPGSDRVQGDSGADVLQGGSGSDWIWARDGRTTT